jgi:hypothetical protein
VKRPRHVRGAARGTPDRGTGGLPGSRRHACTTDRHPVSACCGALGRTWSRRPVRGLAVGPDCTCPASMYPVVPGGTHPSRVRRLRIPGPTPSLACNASLDIHPHGKCTHPQLSAGWLFASPRASPRCVSLSHAAAVAPTLCTAGTCALAAGRAFMPRARGRCLQTALQVFVVVAAQCVCCAIRVVPPGFSGNCTRVFSARGLALANIVSPRERLAPFCSLPAAGQLANRPASCGRLRCDTGTCVICPRHGSWNVHTIRNTGDPIRTRNLSLFGPD